MDFLSEVAWVVAAATKTGSGHNGTNWALILGIAGTALGFLALSWNIYNAISERTARRKPDVHASLVIDGADPNSSLAFMNAGPGLARGPQYLMVENGTLYQGGIGTAFLIAGAYKELDMGFRSTKLRSTLVWGYMDVDGNVHLRSNDGRQARYKHPTRVELGEAFTRFYPNEPLPPGRPLLPYLGEKKS